TCHSLRNRPNLQSSKFAISKRNVVGLPLALPRCSRRGSKALATRHVRPPIGPAKFARWRAALARDPPTFDKQRGVPLTIRGRLPTRGLVAASHVTLYLNFFFSLPHRGFCGLAAAVSAHPRDFDCPHAAM